MRRMFHTMQRRWHMVMALAVILVVAGVTVTVSSAAQSHGNGGQDVCCFTNRAYAGVCQVTPTKDETCASILAYLNNPMSSGKPYCRNTEIRGGWKLIDCHRGAHKKAHPKEHSREHE
ncbi:MAG: hypothetical protein GWP10_16505 [Nitrospiraceae bacterium]|nr:hypothetical protein [Nitrospiraceae bacterium]